MNPLDNFDDSILSIENAKKYLNNNELEKFYLIPDEERAKQLKDLLQKPITKITVINNLYFRTKWTKCINTLFDNKHLSLLEIAAGNDDLIPQMMVLNNPKSYYITTNKNKGLNKILMNKIKDLPLNLTLIDDDAIKIGQYLDGEKVDIIIFHRSVNDVIQAMLCEKNGIDTTYTNWIEVLPKMIEILQNEVENNSLEQHVKIYFFKLIRTLLSVLKKEGVIVINHFMYQFDLNLGYPYQLLENYILLVREWIKEMPECEEFMIDGFDKHWWIFIKKKYNNK